MTIGSRLRLPAAAAGLFLATGTLAAGLAFISPARGAEPVPAATPASVVKQAQALITAGKFDEALAILRPLVRRSDRTVRADVLFNIAVAAVGAAQRRGIDEKRRDALLDQAIVILRSLLVSRPGLVRVRLELARALFLKGEDSLARQHFERVLAGKPPEPVVANVQRFLRTIRARKRWTVRFGVALAPDSNISSRTAEGTILLDTPLGRLPFTYRSDDRPTSGIGLAVWAGGEYQYPLGGPQSRWRLRMGGDISRREYQSDAFDRMFVAGHFGPRWLISRTTEASLLASARMSWLSDETDYYDLGFRLSGGHRLNRRTTTSFNASWHDRRYTGRPWLDGPVVDAAAGLGWVATPTIRLNAAAGWGLQRTKQENQRNASRWIRAGVTGLLPWGFTVSGSGTVRWTDYEGNWVPFVLGGGARRDRRYSVRLNVLTRALTFRGFSPQLSVVHEWRRSNAQLHDYRRTFGEMRLVRQF